MLSNGKSWRQGAGDGDSEAAGTFLLFVGEIRRYFLWRAGIARLQTLRMNFQRRLNHLAATSLFSVMVHIWRSDPRRIFGFELRTFRDVLGCRVVCTECHRSGIDVDGI